MEFTSNDLARFVAQGCRCDEDASPWRHSWHTNYSVACALHFAASDLLEALDDLCKRLLTSDDHPARSALGKQAIAKAEAAIAKATGGSEAR